MVVTTKPLDKRNSIYHLRVIIIPNITGICVNDFYIDQLRYASAFEVL